MSRTDDLQGRYSNAVMNTFGLPQVALVRGEGAHVWDADGNEYVDFLGGIAVNTLGHAHPALVEAVDTQMRTLGHVSNFFLSEPQVRLAEKLLTLLGQEGHVFFANSGAEANEAAFKLTRRTGRTHVVAMEEGFHGRTMGALALTAKAAYREPFEPLPGDVTFVPYGDTDALRAAVTDRTAAVLLEPLQGEAGVNEASYEYLRAAREITSDQGALLWIDEVQTGMGRTGAWFAHAASGVVPDVVTLAKGLAGGVPIGACIGVGEAGALLGPGHHGSTFGGNPVSAAAALAVIATIESEGLLERATLLGARLREGMSADARVTQTRGAGVLVGLSLDVSEVPDGANLAAAVVRAGHRAGFLLNAPTPSRIRLAPPLTMPDVDADALVAAWPGILDAAHDRLRSGS